MAVERRLDFDLANWTAEVAQAAERSADGSALSAAAAIGASAGLALVSMSFRADAGDAALAEPYRAGRADELDDLRATALELVDVEAALAPAHAHAAPKAGPATGKKAVQALERSFDTLELALRGLRLARAGRAGVAPDRGHEWLSGAQLLRAAASTANHAVALRVGCLDGAEQGERRELAQALADEAERIVAALVEPA